MGERERQFVSDMYSGPDWKKKVKHMSDAQVVAIFMKEKNREKPKEKPEKTLETPASDIPF